MDFLRLRRDDPRLWGVGWKCGGRIRARWSTGSRQICAALGGRPNGRRRFADRASCPQMEWRAALRVQDQRRLGARGGRRPSAPYVYLVTTRYGGKKACNGCPDPALILRISGDGGRTFGADRFLCACKGVDAQNDPQIEVAQDGAVYAVWLNDYVPGVVFSRSRDHGRTWSDPVTLKTPRHRIRGRACARHLSDRSRRVCRLDKRVIRTSRSRTTTGRRRPAHQDEHGRQVLVRLFGRRCCGWDRDLQ